MSTISQQFTDIKVLHKPHAALSAYVGPWWVEYKRDGLQKHHAFHTAIEAATFGSKLEVGELDDDVLAGNRPAQTKVGATRGPWRINERSAFGDSYVDIDGAVGNGLVHEWRALASFAVKSEGVPSAQGMANARLGAAAPALRTALLAICDAVESVDNLSKADIYTDDPDSEPAFSALNKSIDTLTSAANAALALLEVLGVA